MEKFKGRSGAVAEVRALARRITSSCRNIGMSKRQRRI